MKINIECSTLLAPSQILDLVADVMFTFIELTWKVPLHPNGIILNYEISYRVSNRPAIKMNAKTNTSFTISNLLPMTRVSEISVIAVNGAGKGEAFTIQNIVTEGLPREIMATITILMFGQCVF